MTPKRPAVCVSCMAGPPSPDNIAPIMAQPDVDGALVGGASLDAGQFAQICRYRELAA